jgi:predicted CXXCH cytochrome family protein
MLAATLVYSLEGPGRSLYLPGPTTSGHYQIELACNACHTSAFSGREGLQEACVRCHGQELREANDSHPAKKFDDPRNADRLQVLNAQQCVTCHREHRPELVSSMGLSLPTDYCYRCHESIGDERSSHAGLAFDTCASAGCHNFHDNRALYEDFLIKHLDETDHVPEARVPARHTRPGRAPLTRASADAPVGHALVNAELAAWENSGHAKGGVNCTGCHTAKSPGASFQKQVSDAVCADCHDAEWQGFVSGRHGMRLAAELEPLHVSEARLPMKSSAAERRLGCTSCHSSHAFDTRFAAANACQRCHDDDHSRAYRGSAHERAWLADASGRSGASCATCHLPRITRGEAVRVAHNQNDNLRPNEKMLRNVCLSCHGLGFALDALADPDLVLRNFNGRPSQHIQSLDMVNKRHPAN